MSESVTDRDRYGHCTVCATAGQQGNRYIDGHFTEVYGTSEWPMLCIERPRMEPE